MKEDGIYITVRRQEPDELINRPEVMKWFELYQVKDIDFDSVFRLFKSEELEEEVKISSNTDILQQPEGIQVTVAPDSMKAYIELIRPGLGGDLLSVKDVVENLRTQGVTYGIDPIAIVACLANRDYGIRMKIADGTEPTQGEDGYLVYHFDDDYNNIPNITDYGVADYHKVHFYEQCEQDQILITSVLPTSGKKGKNVLGQSVMSLQGKPAPRIPPGKNTRLSEDGLSLFSEIDGQIILKGDGLDVSPVLEIKQDVGVETGDISFIGSVVIQGGVSSGFSVSATEGIEVFGTVEGATLVSNGDIILYKGVQGAGKASIMADKRVVSTYVERATIIAGTDIKINSLLNCQTKCYGNVVADGKLGVIVGGYCYANGDITANVLGSAAGTATKLVAGSPPNLIEKIDNLKDELEAAKGRFAALKTIVETLANQNIVSPLNEAKKAFLVSQIHEKSKNRDLVIEYTERLNRALADLDTGSVRIVARKKLCIGVAVHIGLASMVNDDIRGATMIMRDGDKIITT